ncbi:hypothetical protein [Amycolatopsis magusensis]|uniref:hypothetical protein n=1 Tax=Amycolatopsis magusensis TaxID=882444 RepID=UPI003C2C6BB5
MIRLQVQRLPSGAIPKPMWLWHSGTGLGQPEVVWPGRRFCAASTSSTPSACSDKPSAAPHRKLRSPEAADRWTWLLITAYTQLRLARELTAELRRPWENPAQHSD